MKYYKDDYHVNYKGNYKNINFTGSFTSLDIGSTTGPNITNSSTQLKYGTHSINYINSINDHLEFSGNVFAQHRYRIQDLIVFNPEVHPLSA